MVVEWIQLHQSNNLLTLISLRFIILKDLLTAFAAIRTDDRGNNVEEDMSQSCMMMIKHVVVLILG